MKMLRHQIQRNLRHHGFVGTGKLLLTVVAVSLMSLNAFAIANESASASGHPLDIDCTSPNALSVSLDKVQAANAIWVKEKSKAAVQGDWDETSEGRRVELFSAELLPPGNFSTLYRQCWITFVDFQESLIPENSPKSRKPKSGLRKKETHVKTPPMNSKDLMAHQNELFLKWDNCVSVSLDPAPPEARELKACWEKLSHTP